jgi:hypothetical protein
MKMKNEIIILFILVVEYRQFEIFDEEKYKIGGMGL